MFAGSMPNFFTSAFVGGYRGEMAADVRFIARRSRNQRRAVCALVMVSWVVKVLEAMMKSVVSGEIFFRVSAICVPSTLETKWGDVEFSSTGSAPRSP